MNFNWKKMESSDYDIVDKWDSEDIREFITIDNAFTISEFYVMFGFYDNRTSYKAVPSSRVFTSYNELVYKSPVTPFLL